MRLDSAGQLYEENAAYLVKPEMYDHFFFFLYSTSHTVVSTFRQDSTRQQYLKGK